MKLQSQQLSPHHISGTLVKLQTDNKIEENQHAYILQGLLRNQAGGYNNPVTAGNRPPFQPKPDLHLPLSDTPPERGKVFDIYWAAMADHRTVVDNDFGDGARIHLGDNHYNCEYGIAVRSHI